MHCQIFANFAFTYYVPCYIKAWYYVLFDDFEIVFTCCDKRTMMVINQPFLSCLVAQKPRKAFGFLDKIPSFASFVIDF